VKTKRIKQSLFFFTFACVAVTVKRQLISHFQNAFTFSSFSFICVIRGSTGRKENTKGSLSHSILFKIVKNI
jgi:hypothetical protein